MDIKLQVNKFFSKYIQDFSHNIEVYFGSRGSAKSYFVTQKMILKCLEEKNLHVLFTREVRNSIKGTCFKLTISILKQMGIFDEVTVNKTDLTIDFSNGSSICFAGLDNPDSIKSKPKLNIVVYEECDRLDFDTYQTVSSSLRGEGTKQEIFIFNPPAGELFIFSYYLAWCNLSDLYEKKVMSFSNSDVSIIVFHTTWRDNDYCDKKSLTAKYSLLKNNDYYRWLRDSEGKFGINESESVLFNRELIDFALNNKLTIEDKEPLKIGLDVARFGNDKTVLCFQRGGKIYKFITLSKKRGNEIAEIAYKEALSFCEKEKINSKIYINIDSTGVGATVCDALHAFKKDTTKNMKRFIITEINFSKKALNTERYADIISETAFQIRDAMQENKIELLNHKQLIEEMSLRERTIDSNNRDVLSSKQIFKKKFGYSPDFFDAFVLSFTKTKKQFAFKVAN